MKIRYTSRYVSLPVSLMVLGILVFCGNTACKKDKSTEAFATFVIGDVRLARPGENERPVKHKDRLQKDDVIKTGSGSILVFQIGTESLIQVDANTEVALSSFLEKGETKLTLSEGKVFAKIRHLGKADTFQVQTKTSLAAIRGTEFSITYDDGESVVAVNQGTVDVQQVDDTGVTEEKKSVEKGYAAVITVKISIRNLNKNEERELARFEKISPIKSIDSIAEEDLKMLEDMLYKSAGPDKSDDTDKKEDPKKVDDTKKRKTADKKEIAKAVEKETNDTKDTPARNGAAQKSTVWTDKRAYGADDEIIVYYKNLPENRNCWISIARAGAAERSYETYNWTYSAKDGQMKFQRLKLQPGNYEVRIHFNRGNEVNMRYGFQVQ